MPRIREVPSLREWERVSAHSHIQGLGLKGLKALPTAQGMVGQYKAREAAGIIVRLVKEGKFAGRTVLIAGPPGTGKTALAMAIAKELGRDVPFVPIAASEIYSTEIKKTEFLTQALRKAIGVRIHELRKIYEGEVKKIEIERKVHPYNPYQQIPYSATIELATQQERKRLTMDQAFAMQAVQQSVEIGDIIQIDVDGGRLIKLGKSEEAARQMKVEISASQVFPIPKGPVLKEKEFVYVVTLHQLDEISSKRGADIFSLFFGGRERKEIESEARKEVDESIRSMVREGRAEIIPGVLFIDECSLLDIETFAFLNRAMEQELAPIIIFATNRGMGKIRGTDITSPHTLPLDLLDRVLIINTQTYKPEELMQILKIRSKAERIDLERGTLEFLTKIGTESSLRYAIQLLAVARVIAENKKRKKVNKRDVAAAKELFSDVKRSVEALKKYEELMLR
jgi:TBP-interacting protein